MKTVAVIGMSSMLGSRLASHLSSMGIEVLSIGRQKGTDIYLDLEENVFTKPPGHLSADVIFHCAASFADDSNEGIRKNFRTNATSSLLVLELAEQLKCRSIVYAGTVFSSETLELDTFGYYGFSKSQAEGILAWGMNRLNSKFCSLRFPQIYDTAGACIVHQPWFGRIVAYAARGLDLNMPKSDGLRNFLHVDDAAAIMVEAGRGVANGIYNVVHPESFTFHEIASKAYTIFGRGGRVVIDPKKRPFRPFNFPDGSHAFKNFGITPRISIEEGIVRIRDQNTWSAFGPMDVI
jgi:nucleoside-diphosphate-sugar epimerase